MRGGANWNNFRRPRASLAEKEKKGVLILFMKKKGGKGRPRARLFLIWGKARCSSRRMGAVVEKEGRRQ